MNRSTSHILTTHTGSLPRASQLLGRPQNGSDDQADAESLAATVRQAVIDVVERQVQAGVTIVNDGEVSKSGYVTYVEERLEGFGGEGDGGGAPADLRDFPGYMPRVMSTFDFAIPACVGPVSYRDLAPVQADITNLQTAVRSKNVEGTFMSAASPGVIAISFENEYYRSHEDYLAVLADALKTEYDEIYRAGFVLQLDCPDLAMMRHLGKVMRIPDFRRRAELHVEALNHATRDIPSDDIRIHLCWGNYEGPHHHDVALADIIDVVLKANAAGLSFEAANPRHAHEWTVFSDRRLPDDKILIPGVIDSTTNYIEHPELVAQRLVRWAELVGRERVIAGSDCGFATFATYVLVEPMITWAKLRTMADGAQLASRTLW